VYGPVLCVVRTAGQTSPSQRFVTMNERLLAICGMLAGGGINVADDRGIFAGSRLVVAGLAAVGVDCVLASGCCCC